jgi:hypothetical protein
MIRKNVKRLSEKIMPEQARPDVEKIKATLGVMPNPPMRCGVAETPFGLTALSATYTSL